MTGRSHRYKFHRKSLGLVETMLGGECSGILQKFLEDLRRLSIAGYGCRANVSCGRGGGCRSMNFCLGRGGKTRAQL